MAQIHSIHHLEDEPEEILWICGALENRYGLDHPEWLVPDSFDDNEDGVVSFRLQINGVEHTIRHCVYQSAGDFRGRFPGLVGDGDIAIIDLMIGETEDASESISAGLGLYWEVVERLGVDNVFVLTAYSLQAEGAIDSGRIIQKPPDMTAFITRIINLLAVGTTQ